MGSAPLLGSALLLLNDKRNMKRVKRRLKLLQDRIKTVKIGPKSAILYGTCALNKPQRRIFKQIRRRLNRLAPLTLFLGRLACTKRYKLQGCFVCQTIWCASDG